MSKNEQEMCKNVQMRKRCRTNQDTAFDHLWFWTRIVVPTTSSFIFPIIYPLTPSDTVFKVTPNWSHINVPPVFPYYADASLGALVVSRWGLKINASFVASKCVFCVVKMRLLRRQNASFASSKYVFCVIICGVKLTASFSLVTFENL